MPGISKSLVARVIDLSHVEENTGIAVLGLLGQSVFQKHEIVFDLVHQSIQLIPLDKKGDRQNQLSIQPKHEIPFKMTGHLPTFEVQINPYKLILGLDSGAEFNVLDRSFSQGLQANMRLQTGGYLTDGGHRERFYSPEFAV